VVADWISFVSSTPSEWLRFRSFITALEPQHFVVERSALLLCLNHLSETAPICKKI
jgi:hypothetical protein